MAAVYVNNITINSGEDFSQIYDLYDGADPMDLTGYSAQAKLRKYPGSSSYVTFNIGFPNKLEGKIRIFIPAWITRGLKSGRYVYDILLTKPNGKKQIIVEGMVLVRAGISLPGKLPTSAERVCIAVIDENDSNSIATMKALWTQFRSTYPNRIFYLLQPTTSGFGDPVGQSNYSTLRCPDNFLSETTVNVSPLI